MAAWTTIPDSDLDPESPITTSLMLALRDNPIAIVESASGAPPIGQVAIATGIQQNSAALGAGSNGSWALTGGGFHLGYGLGSPGHVFFMAGGNVSAFTWSQGVRNDSGGTQTYFWQSRYFLASPPYDLGNGEIPLFIFVVLNPDGSIHSIDIAPDPPWANNGPTNIRPDFTENGRKMKRRLVLPSKDNPAAYLDALRNPIYETVEITQALKQADMPLIPHPFIGNDLTGKTIVLLEPTGDISHELYLLHEHIGIVSELLWKGLLIIGNTPLDVNAPPGVMPVSLKWKNTG